MTDNEIIKYYVDLLIMQYRDKPNARAFVESVIRMAIMNQLPASLNDAFDLDTAEGVQLDTIAKYVNATRNGNNFSGPMTLTDAQFREFIKICIVSNSSGSSLYEIVNLLNIYFPGVIYTFDQKTMRLDYFFDATIGSQALAEFFIESGRLPKPMAVLLGVVIYIPNLQDIFLFRTYASPAPYGHGFNNYSSYDSSWTWIGYSDVIYP
jgi:hypothetical protein